jgi:hypothetical protein
MNANSSLVDGPRTQSSAADLMWLNRLRTRIAEKVGENAPTYEIQRRGLTIRQRQGISIFYKKTITGPYFAAKLREDQ